MLFPLLAAGGAAALVYLASRSAPKPAEVPEQPGSPEEMALRAQVKNAVAQLLATPNVDAYWLESLATNLEQRGGFEDEVRQLREKAKQASQSAA